MQIITSVQLSMDVGHWVDIGVKRFPNMILVQNEYALFAPVCEPILTMQ